jgi:pyridoxamine 5'-phosphate oxidase
LQHFPRVETMAFDYGQRHRVENRQWLDDRAAQLASELGESPKRPQDWGGYRLVPDHWQFWQGRRISRLAP